MDTILNAHTGWKNETANRSIAVRPENKLTSFINSQEKNETAWFLISMVIQGIFFLPLPAVLIFHFGAPAYILIFTLGLFFANIIAGMSSSGARVIIYLFAASFIVHALMLAIFTL
jgi:hypothetical protein